MITTPAITVAEGTIMFIIIGLLLCFGGLVINELYNN